MKETGLVTEYFCSFQGEGLFAGVKQFFIRFSGCSHISCCYCDTSKEKNAQSFSFDELTSIVLKEWERHHFHDISLTGGEPLEQADFINAFLSKLKKSKTFSIHLETNAILEKELQKVLPLLDNVSADFKLSSVTGERSFKEEHGAFLSVLEKSGTPYFIKAVINKNVCLKEFEEMCSVIKQISPGRFLILQPETRKDKTEIPFDVLEELYDAAGQKSVPVRIIPQTHKMMGIR